MLKRTITYRDYNDVEREEDFYFNLTKAEIMEMEMSTTGGLEQLINKITSTKDSAKIVALFKDLILRAYGEKSDDGRRFMKSAEISDGFAQTEAYSILFMELATDSAKAAAFVNGIVPSDVAAEVAKSDAKITAIPQND